MTKQKRIDRREFVTTTTGAAAAVALGPTIWLRRPQKTLKILQWSHFVPSYDVWFVNPRETSIFGRPVYASLGALPSAPDIVDAFRQADALPALAEEAVAAGARVFWAQLGLWSDAAADIAWHGGLDVVMNRCLKIEHARFAGGLHLAGFDTGVLDSRRQKLV